MNSKILAALFTWLLIAAGHAQTVFTLNKTSFLPGESIIATWSGRTSPKAKDWIGVYPRTVTPGSKVSTIWKYTSNSHTAGTALTAGTVTFTNPGLAVGQWSAYFLADDGYNSLGRVDFDITSAAAQVALSLSKASYVVGEAITVTWSNRISATANDRIGIFPKNTSPTTGVATLATYTSGTQTPGSPLESGSVTFTSPGLALGDWTVHLLDADGITSLASANFSVTAAPPVFTLNKAIYQINEDITVTWSGRTNAAAKDWVGIYPRNLSGVPDGNPASTLWAYTSGSTTASTALSEGSFTFKSPTLPKGEWTAYFLADDGYQILGTVQFTVANSPKILGFTADHSFIDDGTPITLSWAVDPGDGTVQSLILEDGTSQKDVHDIDVLEVSPEQNTTYKLILNGTISAQARVFKEDVNSDAFSIGTTHLSSGSPLTAVWNGATGNPDSWVAIYRAGGQPGNDYALYWSYLNGTQSTGGSFPNGSISFNPTPGEYYAVLFSNGAYTIERGPIRFTVVSGEVKPMAITNFGTDEGDMRLDWNSLPGVTYDIETSTDLLQWNTEAEGIRASGVSSSVFMAPTPDDPSRFYRVRRK